jgi:hypothetical protein
LRIYAQTAFAEKQGPNDHELCKRIGLPLFLAVLPIFCAKKSAKLQKNCKNGQTNLGIGNSRYKNAYI